MRRLVVLLALALVASACADVVIPTEEEAASAGESAAAAADAFIGVFEERAAAELETLMSEIDGDADTEPLFPSTTVDPLDTFDPLNDCRWSEGTTLSGPGFSLTLPAFVQVVDTADGFTGYHANHSYGRCAPIVGDVSVIAMSQPVTAETVLDAQVAAYRSVGELTIVSDGAVNVPGSAYAGHLIEFRTADDAHRAFLAANLTTESVVVLTVHVPVAEWADTAPVALDLFNGLVVG